MSTQAATAEEAVVSCRTGASEIVLVCEHASAHIPEALAGLGLAPADRLSHAVWDPGALAVAEVMAERLSAGLVAGRVSRLVYDCNRPPEAPDAMPARSELIEVPGNRQLSPEDRAERVRTYYEPFRAALAEALAAQEAPVIVTMHSFTPLFHGRPRAVEIGLLHDSDSRLADAMLEIAPQHTELICRRNEPYGPGDGVTHTLRHHALPGGHLNLMIEVRNDLIATPNQQSAMGEMLAGWLAAALAAARGA